MRDTASQMSMTLPALPPKPLPPVDYDCCGGGCADCELRRYQQDLGEWLQLAARHADLQAATERAHGFTHSQNDDMSLP